MAFNPFTYRTLQEVVNGGSRVSSYLRDTYFSRTRSFATPYVDIDVIDERGRYIAPFCSPLSGGTYDVRQGYSVKTYKPAYVAPRRVATGFDALIRRPGDTPYDNFDPYRNMQELIAQDLRDLDEMITRREEAMAAEALFYGKITIEGEGVNDVIDFWSSLTNQPYTDCTASDWTTLTGIEIIQQLTELVRTMSKYSGLVPTRCLLGSNAADALIKALSDPSTGAMDVRHVDLGDISPNDLPNGVAYLGRLRRPNLELYTYEAQYVSEKAADSDSSDTLTSYVPENRILLSSPQTRTLRAYGSVQIITDDGIRYVTGDRAANTWLERNQPAGQVVQLISAPLMVLEQPYGFRVAEVIAS